jgi:hypothetical protein
MQQALGVEGEQDKATEQAVFRFAHTLMHDLRTMAGEETEGPRAWGRRDWGDLSQRLTALATAASAPKEVQQQVGQGEAPVVATTAPRADVPNVDGPNADVPDAPDPLTTATAAVHIMKVPSSHLLEAFVSLQRALGQQSDASNPRDALAELARRLARGLESTPTIQLPAGSLFDTKA